MKTTNMIDDNSKDPQRVKWGSLSPDQREQWVPVVPNPYHKRDNYYRWMAQEAANCGLSVAEMCRRAGVPYGRIQFWKKKNPIMLDAVYRIEVALDEAAVDFQNRKPIKKI